MVRAPAPGTGGSRVRFLPGPRAGVARCNLHFKATCAEQVAQSNLRRPTCTDQFAESALPRATCAEQLTQSNLHRATCTEQLAQSNLQGAQFAQSNLQGATCRDQLAGATCAEQLAQSNLHSATCVEQLAQTNLHRAVCAEHLAWCCLALASRMLRVGKKNASCSVGPTSLAMFCFRANRGLVCVVGLKGNAKGTLACCFSGVPFFYGEFQKGNQQDHPPFGVFISTFLARQGLPALRPRRQGAAVARQRRQAGGDTDSELRWGGWKAQGVMRGWLKIKRVEEQTAGFLYSESPKPVHSRNPDSLSYPSYRTSK